MEKFLFTEQERNQYAEENMQLVYHVAKEFYVSDMVEEELHGAGFVGFTKALNTYDKNLQVAKFSTYACTCIRNEMAQFLRKENKKNAFEFLPYEFNYYDSESAGIFESDYAHQCHFVTEDNTLENMIIQEEFEEVMKVMKTFKPNVQKIVRLRYGIGSNSPMTQNEVAKEINSSQANVCKTVKSCISILKDMRGTESRA